MTHKVTWQTEKKRQREWHRH